MVCSVSGGLGRCRKGSSPNGVRREARNQKANSPGEECQPRGFISKKRWTDRAHGQSTCTKVASGIINGGTLIWDEKIDSHALPISSPVPRAPAPRRPRVVF